VLYVARHDEPTRHHGTVLHVHESAFAPRPDSLAYYHLGSLTATAFRIGYVEHLRHLWRQDRQAFLDLIDLATGGRDLTLVDHWGDEAHAPRKILAAALKQIANSQRSNRARQAQRGRQAPQTSDTAGAGRPRAPEPVRGGARDDPTLERLSEPR
jgi:hypothetical protein